MMGVRVFFAGRAAWEAAEGAIAALVLRAWTKPNLIVP